MSISQINFFSEETSFNPTNKNFLSSWISECIKLEDKQTGEINFIFCSDDYLLKLNQDYLDHDTFTDIVTFNYVSEQLISGDLFISVNRVEDNAKQLQVEFKKELRRVMIHGILHLIGYDDKTPELAKVIRAKEDFYLTLKSKN